MELKQNKEPLWCIHRPVCTPTFTLIRLHCMKSLKSSVNSNWWTFLHAEFRWQDLYVGLRSFFFYIFFFPVQLFFLTISMFYGLTTRQFSALGIHHPECSSYKQVLFTKCREKTSCHNQHPLQSFAASPQLCRASDHLWTCVVSYKRLYRSGWSTVGCGLQLTNFLFPGDSVYSFGALGNVLTAQKKQLTT